MIFTFLINYMASRDAHLFLGFYNNLLAKSGSLVSFNTECYGINNILEFYLAGNLGNDYGIERIPFCYKRSLFYHIAFVYKKFCTVRYVLSGDCNAGVLVNKANFGKTTNDNFSCRTIIVSNIYSMKFIEFQTRFMFGSNCCTG